MHFCGLSMDRNNFFGSNYFEGSLLADLLFLISYITENIPGYIQQLLRHHVMYCTHTCTHQFSDWWT